MQPFEILIFIICLFGTCLLPVGLQITENTRYRIGGWLVAIYGTICGIVAFAGILHLIYLITN